MGRRILLVVVIAAAAAGCNQPDNDGVGTWKPTGTNDQNLRAMLVNPDDIYRGNGALASRGDSASRAVTRLLIDRRRPLLDAATSGLAQSGTGSSDSAPIQTPGSGSSGSAQ